MKRISAASAGLVVLTLVTCLSAGARASQVVAGKITDLTKADVAFTGTCAKVEPMVRRIGAKGKVFATKYTFDVEDVIKGDVPKSFSFTHLGGSRSAARELGMAYIPGMPVFTAGKRYTVFLGSESKGGLRGVISLGVGKFNFVEGSGGKVQVVNDYGNKSLFTGLPSNAKVNKALTVGGVKAGAEPGPMDYESFKSMFKELDRKE